LSPTDQKQEYVLTSRAVGFIITACIFVSEREREYFSPTMSKITHFFAPTSSGSGKRSNASSTSGNNNNKDEQDEPLEPPPKRSLKSTSSEATEARCASSKKSSVSSSVVEGIIKDLFTEDQKKVLHHYHRCRERNCSGLGTDEKQRLSSKKDKFQHEWLFEANVFCEKTGLTWLVFVEDMMYLWSCNEFMDDQGDFKAKYYFSCLSIFC